MRDTPSRLSAAASVVVVAALASTSSAGATTTPAAAHPAAVAPPAAHTAPAPAAGLTLTAQNAQTLPDSAMVLIQGKSVSLAALRASHAARMLRFSQAASLAQSVRIMPSQLAVRVAGTVKTPVPTKVVPPAPNSMALPASQLPIPTDLKAFCAAAAATACIYIPTNSQNLGQVIIGTYKSYFTDTDYLIFDPNVCAADGGKLSGESCVFYYPQEYLTEFITTATPANPLTFTKNCPASGASFNLDPRGAIEILVQAWSTTAVTGCVVDAIEPAT